MQGARRLIPAGIFLSPPRGVTGVLAPGYSCISATPRFVNTVTGARGPGDQDGPVFQPHGNTDMSAKMQWVTGFIAILMLAAAFVVGSAADRKDAQASESRAQEQSHDVRYY